MTYFFSSENLSFNLHWFKCLGSFTVVRISICWSYYRANQSLFEKTDFCNTSWLRPFITVSTDPVFEKCKELWVISTNKESLISFKFQSLRKIEEQFIVLRKTIIESSGHTKRSFSIIACH